MQPSSKSQAFSSEELDILEASFCVAHFLESLIEIPVQIFDLGHKRYKIREELDQYKVVEKGKGLMMLDADRVIRRHIDG